jgi:Zn-dependent peptidase ImmA (M78 family)
MNTSHYPGTNEDIEQIATSLLEVVSEQAEEELRGRRLLDEIVRITEGTIEMVEDPSQQEADGGSLIIRGESDFTIALSPYTTPLRDNFTIGHELGHYFLHYYLQTPRPALPLTFTRYGTGLIEWQANRFAAALLMPAEAFRNSFKEFGGDEFLLAGYFEVSRPAVQVRAQSLRLGNGR